MTIADRGRAALNLAQFNHLNNPETVGDISLTVPFSRTYVLRMLIKHTFSNYQIPKDLEWTTPIIEMAQCYQDKIGISHPFCYLTIRSGEVTSETDDNWHVDGFSTRITHLPEQNYIWADHTPSEYVVKRINIPSGFNPRKHNIHLLFQDVISEKDSIYSIPPQTVCCMDPYVIHRRPKFIVGKRTFIRVSHTPIEISDINNTINPLLPTQYNRDGIKDFRNSLERFIQ